MKSASLFTFIITCILWATTASAQYSPLGSTEKDLKTYSKSEIRKYLLDLGVDPEIRGTLKAGQRYNIAAYTFYGLAGYYGLFTTVSLFYVLTEEDNRVAVFAMEVGASATLVSYFVGRWMTYLATKRYREALNRYYDLHP